MNRSFPGPPWPPADYENPRTLPPHDRCIESKSTGTRPAPTNHCTIVGRRRRARTEARILTAAIHVFAERGRQGAVIDDFITAAGIARGTFYNYFRSTDELLSAASDWLSDDLHQSIGESIRGIEDPLVRFGIGIRMWMQKAEDDRAFCGFMAQIRLATTKAGERPIRDLKQARKAELLNVPSVEAAIDLMDGTATSAMHRMHQNPELKNHGDQITVVILRGLGASEDQIAELMKRPLPNFRRPPRLSSTNACSLGSSMGVVRCIAHPTQAAINLRGAGRAAPQ